MPYALQQPTVGPIVGHTTVTEARIFLRGDGDDPKLFRRMFGAVRWRRHGSTGWAGTVVNKLEPHFDLSGVFVLAPLAAATRYDYQGGWFVAADDDEVEDIDPADVDWDGGGHADSTFSTPPATPGNRSYVVGSCRYLLRLFGGTFLDDRGDKVFRSVQKQIDAGQDVDALLMIGDQIYADDLNVVLPDHRLDEFLKRYRVAFRQQHLRTLMSRVPTYMILDDHEIEDNWPSNADDKDRLTLYPNAIHAYQIYQASHGPLFAHDGNGRISGTLSHFWYSFSDAVADWFLMDVRTERDPSVGRMVGAVQMQALLDWLADGSGRIKFVVSSVPMFPDMASDSADKWGAFPGQRKEILDFVFGHRIPKVVIVSGDVHCSFSCTLHRGNDSTYAVHGVVSSSFFWPYPHMSRGSFLFGQPLSNMGMHALVATVASNGWVGDDNFTRLNVSAAGGLQVSVYERKGTLLDGPLTLF